MRLSSKARSIYNELRVAPTVLSGGVGSAGEEDDDGEDNSEVEHQERVSTSTLSGVADVLSSVKGLVSWLNRLVDFYIKININYSNKVNFQSCH